MMTNHNGTILSVNDLKTYFQTEDGIVKAVDGITFTLEKGETLGIVHGRALGEFNRSSQLNRPGFAGGSNL